MTRVFVSYSHDSAAHMGRVLALTQQLRQEGVDAWCDRFVESPSDGWPRWTEQQVRDADFVLLVCTATLFRRWEGREAPGVGLGLRWEADAIVQTLYETGGRNDKFIPVLFDNEPDEHIPPRLRGVTRYRLDRGYKDLYRRLTGQPVVIPGPLGPIRRLAPLPALKVHSAEPSPAEPMPIYPDEAFAALAKEAEALEAQREELTITGAPADTIKAIADSLLDLRRKMRTGATLKPGDALGNGRFRLVEIAGSGGFGTVWKAYDRRDRRLVAVKVLHAQHSHDKSRCERFFRGAREMAKLRHPGIVAVVEAYCQEEGFYYFVMEWLPSGDLRALVRQKSAPIPVVSLILAVGEALQHAHEHGLVHRDAKPENILLDAAGRPHLSDFDLVWAGNSTGGTRTGAALGSYVYAAPEALNNAKQADVRSDVFGLGMTAVFCLHGADLPYEDVVYDREAFLAALPCSDALRTVLKKAVAVKAADRFATMQEFCAALGAAEQKKAARPASGPAGATSRSPLTSGLPQAVIRLEPSGIELVYIPGGTFRMGSPATEQGHDSDEGPQREVTVPAFYLARYPVTNKQYQRFLATNRHRDRWHYWHDQKFDGAQQPVVGVSWDEVQQYCQWAGLRLPSEAEWEYACRAGTTTARYNGDSDQALERIAWYFKNSDGRTHPVGEKEPNAWGLYDMLGNVWEWCEDDWHDGYQAAPKNSLAWVDEPRSSYRVFRGGSWLHHSRDVRAADHGRRSTDSRVNYLGFRVAKSIP